MAILVNKSTTVLIQGISGKQGSLHTKFMLEYGVNVAAGVTPGKGGGRVHEVPVYDSVAGALDRHGMINASLIMVPAPAALKAGVEAINNQIPLVVIVTEHLPIHDALKLKWSARERGVTLVGPNTIGIISPGKSKVGIMPGFLYSEGCVGVASRSGTMTHEVASSLTRKNIGQSTCVGIGGDPATGFDFIDALKMFLTDDETKTIVLIGEIGGFHEEQAARYLRKTGYPKPVYAFIGGKQAPGGRKMGHAGALVSGDSETAASKTRILNEAGVEVKDTVKELVQSIALSVTGSQMNT